MSDKQFLFSETFLSMQGEGTYTGRATAWLRWYLCNLQCDGFGQVDPTNPDSYVLPYVDFDVGSIKRVEDLPVFEYGCDSSYTWAKKYKHLMHKETAAQICDRIENCMKSPYNQWGMFHHPASGQETNMAFTGGEPMLNQAGMVAVLEEFKKRNNMPKFVTIETNGTKPFDKKNWFDTYITMNYELDGYEWFWSVSPKLWSTAGEKFEKAIQPDVVGSYAEASDHGQLKYVVNGTDASWREVERNTQLYRDAGVNWDVYIMPVGATKDQQEDKQIAEIVMEAMRRGYHVSGRLHCYIFGNQIGT